jgi:hypothetical protein
MTFAEKMAEIGYEFPEDVPGGVSEEEIRKLEATIDSTLPDDYREFLKQFGYARWSVRPWDGREGLLELRLNSFSGLGSDGGFSIVDYLDCGLPRSMLVIAEADGCTIVLATKGANRGKVYAVIMHEIPDGFCPEYSFDLDKYASPLTDSFSDLLYGLHQAERHG